MKKKQNKSGSAGKWIVLIFVVVIVCSILITELMASNNKIIKSINVEDYISSISGDDEKLILLTEDDCSKCDDMKKVLQDIKADNNIDVYSINVDELSDDALEKLKESSDLVDENILPTVLHISAGEIIGSYTEGVDYDDVMAFISPFKQITVDQYVELINDDEKYFVYIGRPTCHYCVQSMPWTKRISYDLDKDIYYIDIDKETSGDLSLLAKETDDIYSGATPLFLIVENGKVIDYQEGAGSYDSLSAFFNETSEE